jgi:ubiquinone/menaquinone biosynthesis C-methylase UbiE
MSAKTADIELQRQYVKLCDVRDFDDPIVRARIDDIVPGLDPAARRHRKNWEYAMLTLFLEDTGLIREDIEILSVGAGHETVLFWLANRVGKVVATDIYGEGSFGEGEADRTMLTDPASFAPYAYREPHLEVRQMDARALEFPDGSFNAVFSLSSIEHFGSWADIRRSAQEMGRILRPGGAAFIATECFLGRSLFTAFVQEAASRATGGRMFGSDRVFTPKTLIAEIVEPSGLQLVQPLDKTLSPETGENVIEMESDKRIRSTSGVEYPHVVVRAKRNLGRVSVHTQRWTSVGLAMTKPSG